MKQCLILTVLSISAVSQAQQAFPAVQQVADARPVPAKTVPAAQPAQPRHLSEQERAELRRQLLQFSRQNGKGS
jgi:hypothetical protein